MTEAAAAASAVLGLAVAIAVVSMPGGVRAPAGVRRVAGRWWAAQGDLARGAGWGWLDARTLIVLEVASGCLAGLLGAAATGLPVLAIPAAAAAVSAVRGSIRGRGRARQARRQDAVLEAARMLRQLLETGATSVNQAIAVLGERGPLALRAEFRLIAARSIGRRQAWKEARARIGEPLFDMLAAAVLIQRPGGGELVPLFADLEASVSAAQEVEREARALQAQARSASSIIVALPFAFLLILSSLRSPYLDAFRRSGGEVFLLAMFGVMGAGYLWMRRLLELPGLQRVRLSDA
jgi:Flp pilus assembly protein TadB